MNEKPQAPGYQSRKDLFEVEILDGIKSVCKSELFETLGSRVRVVDSKQPDELAFEYSGDVARLREIKTAVAVFQLLYFKVPRPQSIIQEPNLPKLIEAIKAIQRTAQFKSFRIGAAGSDSPTFQKIKTTISKATGLKHDENDGQMVIRFRRSRVKAFGWDVLIRLTPLPLSARSWRNENMPGALNGTIAAAMVRLMEPKSTDRFLNVMCGSGTFLAERAAFGDAESLTGVDLSQTALKKANTNLRHLKKQPALLCEDAQKLSLATGGYNAVCADLPWGRLVGEPTNLGELYANSLQEMTRVTAANGVLAIITQENKLFDEALTKAKSFWTIQTNLRVKQSDYQPKIYILRRTATPM